MWLLLLCSFLPVIVAGMADPRLCINHPTRVSACFYNNKRAISCALSPSCNQFHLFSLVATGICGHHPGSSLALTFAWSFLLARNVSLNPGPGVCGLCLRTVNAHSVQDKAPALSDLVTSKGINLLGITETWLTTKETSADLADMTPSPGFLILSQTYNTMGRGSRPVCIISGYIYSN